MVQFAYFRIFKMTLFSPCDIMESDKGGDSMKRLRDLMIFALCIVLALAPVVSANSGPTYYEGTTATGMIFTGEDCPIVVEEELLTFHISKLPGNGLWEVKNFETYTDHVTAQYTFRNPTDADLTVGLLFPFGTMPDYAPNKPVAVEKYTVTADGQSVEAVLRHSLSWGDFDMDKDSARLHDGFMAHPFYSPDMTVTKYTFRPVGVSWEEGDWIRAKVRLDSDPAQTKYIADPGNSFSKEKDHVLVGGSLREQDVFELYIIGAVPEEAFQWILTRGDASIDGRMELVSNEEMTLKDYVLFYDRRNNMASESDWYNAFVEMLDLGECAYGYLDVYHDLELMCWYEYELTIPAGQTLVNTVTAPVYPDINAGWEPNIYSYEYLLSPAKGWADFGKLTIRLDTPFHMTQCNLDCFEKTEAGYELELDGLPDRELIFVLSADAKPTPPGSNAMKTACFFGVTAVLLVIGVIWYKRR